MKQSSIIQKLGCKKNCLKPCARSQQPEAKKHFELQHQHQTNKLYQKLVQTIDFMGQCKKIQRLIIEQQIKKNFQRFREQIGRLQLQIYNIFNTILESDYQINQGIAQGDKMRERIQKLKKKEFQSSTCNDIYLVAKYLKGHSPSQESLYESKAQESKRTCYEQLAQNEIKERFSSFKYQLTAGKLANLEHIASKQISQVTKFKRTRYRSNQSQIVINESGMVQSQYSSHLSRVTSQKNYEKNSFELSSVKSQSVVEYKSFVKGISKNIQNIAVNEKSIDLPVISQKKEKTQNKLKKDKNKHSGQSDEQLKEALKDFMKQKISLVPQQITQVTQEQSTTELQPSICQTYDINDLSQQQKVALVLERSKQQVREGQTKNNNFITQQNQSLSFTKNNKASSHGRKQESSSRKQLQHQLYLMDINQIHKLTDKLCTSKQKFIVEVKVVALIDVMLLKQENKNGNKTYRYKLKFLAADNTGCAIFFIQFDQVIEPGLSIRLFDCYIKSYGQLSNYQIQTNCRKITLLQQCCIKSNFSIMMSRLNHIKNRWNYELRISPHLKINQMVMLYKKESMEQMLVKKQVIVSVIKKFEENQYLVGDYTGRIRLLVEGKLLKKIKLGIEQNDVLHIVSAKVTIAKKQMNKDGQVSFLIKTDHQNCTIFNIRNHNLKLYGQLIPED